MADYPRQCPCCEKTLTSASDFESHLHDLQSRVAVLIAAGGTSRTKSSRAKSSKCPYCTETFISKTHMNRHRYKHYTDWKRKCGTCNAEHERASAYILHSCGKAGRPGSKEIRSRQQYVDDERSKVVDTLSMQDVSQTLWQESYM